MMPNKAKAQLQMVWPQPLLTSPPSAHVCPGYSLRTYWQGDEPGFYKVMALAGWPGWNDESMRPWVARIVPQCWYMAVHEESGGIVATAMGLHDHSDAHPFGGELGWVAGHPAHAGHGLGAAVSAAVTARLIGAGYRNIHLYTEDERLAALKVYLRLGYVPFLASPDMQERWQAIYSKLNWPHGDSLTSKEPATALPPRLMKKDFYTEAEYLAWERDAPYKSEYVNGQIIPLNGEVRRTPGSAGKHGQVLANAIGSLWVALKGDPCHVLTSDAKVRSGAGSLRSPDALVVCGIIEYHDQGQTVIANPVVLVEVLSPGTEAADRGDKLHEYQGIENLQSYLLVSQNAASMEHYTRRADGQWMYQTVQGLESTLAIPALNITLALADIYEGIDFEAVRGD